MLVILVSFCVIIAEVLYMTGGFQPIAGDGTQEETRTAQGIEPHQAEAVAMAYEKRSEESAEEPADYEKYVFVGDSRYVGMSVMAQESDVFISEKNMGYGYLVDQMDTIKRICDEKSALIIGLGVNDINYSSDNYVAKLNEMASQMDCQIYYMLVNPVDETKEALYGYSVRNDKIDAFNEKMIRELDPRIRIIDTNSYLKSVGYLTVDGLHYATETYRTIYDYIKASL